jgi:hypothetical protein
VFLVRLPDSQGILGNQAHPLNQGRLASIKFTSGLGHLTLADGREFPGVTVVSAQMANGDLAFSIRPANSAAADPAHTVASAQVQRIVFNMPDNWAELTEQNTPPPATEEADESVAEAEAEEIADWDDDYVEEDASVGDLLREAAGGGLLLLTALAQLFLGLLISTLVFYFIAKWEKIPNVGFKRSALCAVYLAVVPYVCLPLLCVPCFGGIIYLVGVLFATRAIIMGMMEVLEGQAWTIILIYVAINFGLFWSLGEIFGLDTGLW